MVHEKSNQHRSTSKMYKHVKCWGADKPFANIPETTLAKNVGLTMCWEPPRNLQLVFAALNQTAVHLVTD
ncbi:hypothetical protein MRX96_027380 [Rhipicephalus microplus]